MKPEDVDRSESFRLDFVQTVLKVDEASHTVVVKLEPDPKRYEWREIRDRRYLYDRFDNIAISEEAYHDLAKQVTGKPIYYQPNKIDNIEQYVKSRSPIINRMIYFNHLLLRISRKNF
ncbi:hypothetical protein ES703_69649 [subsurface metagenome]